MRRLILSTVLLCACMALTLVTGRIPAGFAMSEKDRSVPGDPSQTSHRAPGMEMLAANEKNDNAGSTDPEKPIATSPGREFDISLQSNRTTGFMWQLASPLDASIVQFVGSEYKAPKSRLQGAGGTEVWTFRSVGPGQATISMKYARPWEKNVPPVKTVTFKIVSQ
ncbi:MAG: protease inhibitor I42 family protein [Syntrophobacteraceae bacterium]|nr:protease inhibitor I42 family protein [Desulfobacteraceae bacterium]